MSPRNLVLSSLVPLALVAVSVCLVGPSAPRLEARNQDSSARAKRSDFMKLKLEYSKNVLEGLTLERLEQVAKNARLLKELSAAAQWEIATVPGMEYNNYTAEFQRIADDLGRHAKEKNLDGATLAYVRLTMNCINCHKYVRTVQR